MLIAETRPYEVNSFHISPDSETQKQSVELTTKCRNIDFSCKARALILGEQRSSFIKDLFESKPGRISIMTQIKRTSQNGSSAADDQQTALAIELSNKIKVS